MKVPKNLLLRQGTVHAEFDQVGLYEIVNVKEDQPIFLLSA